MKSTNARHIEMPDITLITTLSMHGRPFNSLDTIRRWASAAKAKGIPVSVISEGMGHNSESTTNIYLASLDTSVVDRANQIILTSL